MTESTPANKSLPSDKKILLIDDDESIIAVLRATLEVEGFQIKTGRDGRNVLQKSLDFKPDLIISDLMMPGGGGFEVLRSLQADPITRKIPVFLVTGSHMDTSTKAMMQQESNLVGYFEKPFRPENILRNVHKVLNTISRSEQGPFLGRQAPTGFDDVL